MSEPFNSAVGKHLLFYDGVCKVCDGLVQYILPRDEKDEFRFIALQSQMAIDELTRYGKDATLLDTVYLITDYGTPEAKMYEHSEAVFKILIIVGGFWKIAYLGWLVPKFIRDWVYKYQAARRYSWFGRHDVCKIPSPEQMHKFIAYG